MAALDANWDSTKPFRRMGIHFEEWRENARMLAGIAPSHPSRKPRPQGRTPPTFAVRCPDGTSAGCAPAPFRVHHHVSLHLPATDDGPRAAARVSENEGAAHGRRTLQSSGAILGANFRNQF